MSQYVYHFKPNPMIGSTLIPLNQLGDLHPEAYKAHAKKYQGRERLLKKQIQTLDCLWNDVLHLSPINPNLIIDTLREMNLLEYSGLKGTWEAYKIPATLLSENTTVCYQSHNLDFNNFKPELEVYSPFKNAIYKEDSAVNENQKKAWQQDHDAKRGLFWYSHTMHILAKQSIDISSCEIIKFESVV